MLQLQPNAEMEDELLIIGKFGRPHGIKGLITVISFTNPRENILRYVPWHGLINQIWQPITLENVTANQTILAQIKGCNSREQAARWTNIEISAKRNQLPELNIGEYYWHDLIGLRVVTLLGVDLGTVEEMMATGSNDVLVVNGEKRHLIPYLPETVVLSVDRVEKVITVDWDADF